MKNSRQSYISTHRDSWVEINLEKLAQNVKAMREIIPQNIKFLGICKADAYGHGAVMCAPTMLASGVDMLGVASIDEGLNLRDAKIKCPILVVGAVPVWSVETAVKGDIEFAIFSDEHIEACKDAFERIGIMPKVHIKLDTGMNRIGVSKNCAVDFIKKVQECDFIELKGIFTHLANAEKLDKTRQQFEIWEDIISKVNTQGLLLHILNTAAIMSKFKASSNMVRTGISLYGLYPDLYSEDVKPPKLSPIMSLKARIVNIHTAKTGEGVSYGHTFEAYEDVKIATVPLGYADGVPRILSNKIFAKINGKKIRQIGNITMDQMMFDITGVDAKCGDIITVLDEDLPIDDWANILNTINYELTCRLKVRLPRVYTR